MTDELQAMFLPRFLASARTRIERVRDIVVRREHGSLIGAMRDLHAIAGEAGLLGLGAVMPLARTAEKAAFRTSESRSEADAAALESALDELGRGLELVTPPPSEGAT